MNESIWIRLTPNATALVVDPARAVRASLAQRLPADVLDVLAEATVPWVPGICYPTLPTRLRRYGYDNQLDGYISLEFGGPEPMLERVIEKLMDAKSVEDAGRYHTSEEPPDSSDKRVHEKGSGVGSEVAWSYPGGTGWWNEDGMDRQIRVAVIEWGYRPHAWLPPFCCISLAPDRYGECVLECGPGIHEDHCTNTLGVLFADHDSPYVRGICYEAAPFLVVRKAGNLTQAIDAASLHLRWFEGDVLLIESQDQVPDPYDPQATVTCPVEATQSVRAGIRDLVSGMGVTVIEPAGNGKSNLGALAPDGQQIWNPADPLYVAEHSGAVIVGAGHAPGGTGTPHSRWSESNHGDRVDCQGWGEKVRTTVSKVSGTGGPLIADVEDLYGGTSAAAAMVAGVAACFQGAYSASVGEALHPASIRACLQDPSLGTPQAGTEHIGPLPDLARLFSAKVPLAILAPFIRDSILDQIVDYFRWLSPDIFVGPIPLPDPPGPRELAHAGSPHPCTELTSEGGNELRLRLHNPTSRPFAIGARVHLVPPGCFPHPARWSNAFADFDLALEVGEWSLTHKVPIPPTADAGIENAGFVVVLHKIAPLDRTASSVPELGPLTGLATEAALVLLRSGRVVLRNAAVRTVVPGGEITLPLDVHGLPDRDEPHRLKIQFPFPPGKSLEVARSGPASWLEKARPVIEDEKKIALGPGQLEAGARAGLEVNWRLPKRLPPGDHEVVLRQWAGPLYLGQFTYVLRVAGEEEPTI